MYIGFQEVFQKKNDQFKLSKTHCKNFKAFVVGKNFIEFKKYLKNKVIVKNLKNLKKILREIFFDIKKERLKKNIILFSPAGASFDNFKNFEERGLYFNQLIKKIINVKRQFFI